MSMVGNIGLGNVEPMVGGASGTGEGFRWDDEV